MWNHFRYEKFIVHYIDDILVHSKSHRDDFVCVRKELSRLEKAGFKLNVDKSKVLSEV